MNQDFLYHLYYQSKPWIVLRVDHWFPIQKSENKNFRFVKTKIFFWFDTILNTWKHELQLKQLYCNLEQTLYIVRPS